MDTETTEAILDMDMVIFLGKGQLMLKLPQKQTLMQVLDILITMDLSAMAPISSDPMLMLAIMERGLQNLYLESLVAFLVMAMVTAMVMDMFIMDMDMDITIVITIIIMDMVIIMVKDQLILAMAIMATDIHFMVMAVAMDMDILDSSAQQQTKFTIEEHVVSSE